MIGIWTKIKMAVGAVFVALLPLLYVLGVRRGKEASEMDQLERAAKSSREQAVFYRELGELNEKIDRPRNRDELVGRLRDKGL